MSNHNDHAQTQSHDPTDAPGPITGHTPHHISEFGQVENLVHIDAPIRLSVEDALPAPPTQKKDKLAVRERLLRLRHKCFHRRHVHQYWHGETLFRTAGNRSIGPDELFLDLVIVGGIAALGHELRVDYDGWRSVEKFLLLFGAIYSSWRSVVFLWNLWGVASDLTDKIAIYIVFTCLTFISLGSHGAFSDNGVRPYVAVSAFLATAIPIVINMIWGWSEPLLRPPKSKTGKMTQLTVNSVLTVIAVSPYLAAAFVRTDRVTRILYWAGFIASSTVIFISGKLYQFLTRDNKMVVRIAVSIELFVEKYDVLTMIVLGESVLGILFEGAELVTGKGVRLGYLYGAAAMATAMLYSLQTLYNNVDGPIAKGGKHAIRYNRWHGMAWSVLHLPYHAALILLATGIGIAMRDIAIPPKYEDKEAVDHMIVELAKTAIHAGGGGDKKGFTRSARWLFSAGWGASMLLSGIIGALHYAGPRAATKRWRFICRCIIVLPIMIGMPFSDLEAFKFIAVYMVILVVIALVEFVFVQMDKMGFFRSEATLLSSSTDALGKEAIVFGDERDDDSFSDDDDDDDDEVTNDKRAARTEQAQEGDAEIGQSTSEVAPQEVTAEGRETSVADAVHDEEARNRLQARLCRSHRNRLVAASRKKCMLEKQSGVDLG